MSVNSPTISPNLQLHYNLWFSLTGRLQTLILQLHSFPSPLGVSFCLFPLITFYLSVALLLHLLLSSSNWYNISWSLDTVVRFCLFFFPSPDAQLGGNAFSFWSLFLYTFSSKVPCVMSAENPRDRK